ncbi:MAG: homocysteine S-methyltransferase family protein [Clostridia bacterium]|nr:homocysteine S-methyltransferase family protein [Clostridia bacterium]
MNILDFIKENLLFLDGGMGTLLQSAGLVPGESPERWCLTHPDVVTGIHRDYYRAGSHVVNTNTFGANLLHFPENELEEIIAAAIDCARNARESADVSHPMWVALDIGPLGKLLKPYGDLDFEEAVSLFAHTVKLGVKYGADLIMIETMNDSYETKAALLAAKENSSLPVIVSNAYGEDGKLMTGASPAAMTALLEGMGADIIGVNCSLGPDAMVPIIEEYLRFASIPVLAKPNAGLPRVENGRTVFDTDPAAFAGTMKTLVNMGLRAAGGCCGTTPAHIRAMTETVRDIAPVPVTDKNLTMVSSYTHAVVFGDSPILIGERINPTGKKRFKEALRAGDIGYILNEGIRQQEKGAHILDVNVGLPEIDEGSMLETVTCELQAVVNLPLQIDTTDPCAMERALRRVNGKALINSVNGKEESMRAIFPLVKKYGGVAVALTLDENGIPETAAGRVEIARKILQTAAEYGIAPKDILFDTLAMAVSADSGAALASLGALREIRYGLGCHTSLGVSNISFGLPDRSGMNSTFFALALENGLSAAIMNPDSPEMMKTYFAWRSLHGLDEHCGDYIGFVSSLPAPAVPAAPTPTAPAGTKEPEKAADAPASDLQRAIIKGMGKKSGPAAKELLGSMEPLDIVSKEIIPALDLVGKGFETGKVYLPQLLMSAEAARCAFEEIKLYMQSHQGASVTRYPVVIATVHGDIHDIGKNIVKLLLENYGFAVTDLGKDVPAEEIAEAVVRLHAPLCGLSALMTTTVPAMEETIALLRKKAPWCKVVVGGAVLTQEYADRIGADKYARDAMETVRYALSLE